MADLSELQKEVREVNELNGWFDTERPFSADIALLHSEVSEMYEGFRNNDAENMAEEAADILIRALDTAERKKVCLVQIAPARAVIGWPVSMYVANLHNTIALMGGYEATPSILAVYLQRLVNNLAGFASEHGIDLLDEVRKKLERNRQRGYRHGGKVE